MRPIRVCHVITELAPAGAERTLFEFCRRLNRRRFQSLVIGLRGGAVADWLRREGVPVETLGVRGKWDFPKLAKLVRIVRAFRPDILHTHLFHADLAGRLAARLTGVPRLVHSVYTTEGRFRPWQYAWARLAAPWCDRIVAASPSVRRVHARRSGLPQRRYVVVPLGVDVGAFARNEKTRRALRRQWGIPRGQTLLAYVGRLHREKGLDVLLSAMKRLSDEGRPRHLVLAGDGPMRPEVEAFLSRGEGRLCRALGFTRDVAGVLSAADVLVVPSRWEGWPVALAEGMAAGLPVIATAVPGVLDLTVNGETAILVAPEDAAALAAVIDRLAGDEDLRARLGAAAVRKARGEFEIAGSVAAIQDLYAELATGRVT